MNKDLSHTHRAVLADPENPEVKLDDLIARSRIYGLKVFLDLLSDQLKWSKLNHSVQDVVIQAVDKIIGDSFKYIETKKYHGNENSCRIATFKHKVTGIDFQLVPGLDFFDPGDYLLDDYIILHGHLGDSDNSNVIKPLLISKDMVRDFEFNRVKNEMLELLKQNHGIPSWIFCKHWLETVGDGLRMIGRNEWESINSKNIFNLLGLKDRSETRDVELNLRVTKTIEIK